MKKWKRAVIHISDSSFGTAQLIKKWHTERPPNGNGWSDIGYHFILPNGWVNSSFYLGSYDGSLEIGRPIDGDGFVEKNEMGAHAYGINSDSIGICLIGKEKFSVKQWNCLKLLAVDMHERFNLNPEDFIGHYEHDAKKTCPNFDVSVFRKELTFLKEFN